MKRKKPVVEEEEEDDDEKGDDEEEKNGQSERYGAETGFRRSAKKFQGTLPDGRSVVDFPFNTSSSSSSSSSSSAVAQIEPWRTRGVPHAIDLCSSDSEQEVSLSSSPRKQKRSPLVRSATKKSSSLVIRRKTELKGHYSADEFLAILGQIHDSHDTRSLNVLVNHVFGNELVFGRSFLAETPTKAGARICLDFVSIRVVYKELVCVLDDMFGTSSSLIHAQSRALEIGTTRQDDNSQSYATPLTRIRMLVLILENPLISDPIYFDILTGPLCLELQRLSPQIQEILVNYFTQYDTEGLRGIVVRLQNFLTLRLLTTYVVNVEERAAISVLSIFARTNKSCRLLPLEEFYNDAINTTDCNLEEEYLNWKARHIYRTMTTIRANKQFTFFDYSFLLAPYTKSRLLRYEARIEQHQNATEAIFRVILTPGIPTNPYLVLRVNRKSLLSDTMQLLESKEADLKKPLRVVFNGEDGIDAGGVTKEFFQLIVREMLVSQRMFSEIGDTNMFWFSSSPWVDMTQDENGQSRSSNDISNPSKQEANEVQTRSERLKRYELFGKAIGLALFNQVVLELAFPPVLYKKLRNYPIDFSDLIMTFPELGTGLEKLRDMSSEELDMMGFVFDVSKQIGKDKYVNVELKPGGSEIPVTIDNREEFLHLYADYKLNVEYAAEFQAFYTGFMQLCHSRAIDLCEPEELEQLLCGAPTWDFEGLERGTKYSGWPDVPEDSSQKPSADVITHFWDLFHSLETEQKKKFLFFVTGAARAPIQGLSKLKFIIMNGGTNANVLPSAHTCFNTFILPQYTDKNDLKKKLLIALENSEGFGLR